MDFISAHSPQPFFTAFLFFWDFISVIYCGGGHVAIVLIKKFAPMESFIGIFFCFSLLCLISFEYPNSLTPPHTSHRKVLFDIRGTARKTRPGGELHSQKGNGPVGAPRAKISPEGRGTTRAYKLRAQERKGVGAPSALISADGRGITRA